MPSRLNGRLRVEISDNGRGLPVGFDWRESRSLGLSIVNTLVAEMEGSFELGRGRPGRAPKRLWRFPSRRKRTIARAIGSSRAWLER